MESARSERAWIQRSRRWLRPVPWVLPLAGALIVAFIVRGICWEAVAWTLPVGALVVLLRWKDRAVSLGVASVLVVGLAGVEAVNVFWFHSILLTTTPRMMVWCGTSQDLAPTGNPVTIDSTRDFERAAGAGPVIHYGVTPEGSAIVGAGDNASWGCQWQIFVAVGNHRWVEYIQDPEP